MSWENLEQICKNALEDGNLTRVERRELLNILGDTQRFLNDHVSAEATYRSIFALQVGDAGANEGLGWIAFDEKNFQLAAEFFERAVSEAPSAFRLAGLAGALFRAGEIEISAANELHNSALSLDPESSWVLREKGWNNYDAGNFATAKSVFEEALELWSEDENAHAGLSYSLYNIGDYRLAVDHISRAIELASEEEPILLSYKEHRAFALWSLSRFRQAIKDAESLIEDFPDNSAGYVLKARILHDMGATNEAIALLTDLALDPEGQYFVYYWLAQIQKTDLRFEAALSTTEKAKLLPSADGYMDNMRAEIALGLNDTALAREMIRHAFVPGEWTMWSYLLDARIMVREGRMEDAQKRLGEALELGLTVSEISTLAREMIKQGDFKAAIALSRGSER
ncbi:tetratricopeptide repeat protein [Cognatishimia activa]|uniref:tetratricopeptide repeat protein n=1 Tax=Cognatishimia activa TaxID=1715691 RepID=UPI0013F4C10F|nr:tetratricopeptide repeat protein [Cognatishimia activa]